LWKQIWPQTGLINLRKPKAVSAVIDGEVYRRQADGTDGKAYPLFVGGTVIMKKG
jgi:hypothetical protein